MNRRGVLGQILTSFPSLIFVFFIMVLFIIISGFIGKSDGKGFNFEDQNIESRVLLELFLEDEVTKEEAGLTGGGRISIKSLLGFISLGGSTEQKRKVTEFVQKRFHEYYSCGKNNVLSLRRYVSAGNNDKRYLFIEYPGTYENLEFPAKEGLAEESTEQSVFCGLNDINRELGMYAEVLEHDKSSPESRVCVRLEAKAIC